MKTQLLFEVWVGAGRRERIERVLGSLGFALLVARSLACAERAPTELSMSGDVPFVGFDGRGRPSTMAPFVLPVLDPWQAGLRVEPPRSALAV